MAASDAVDEFLRRVNGDRQEVPEMDQRKPDPSEPWRYVCPECGGQVQWSDGSYLCGSCNGRCPERDLHDRKAEGDPVV